MLLFFSLLSSIYLCQLHFQMLRFRASRLDVAQEWLGSGNICQWCFSHTHSSLIISIFKFILSQRNKPDNKKLPDLSDRQIRQLIVAAEEGFALAAARVHGGCNMPPACCQEPPFRILCLFAKKQPIQMDGLFLLAAEEGFEPSQTESESGVLPLHNSARTCVIIPHFFNLSSSFLKFS